MYILLYSFRCCNIHFGSICLFQFVSHVFQSDTFQTLSLGIMLISSIHVPYDLEETTPSFKLFFDKKAPSDKSQSCSYTAAVSNWVTVSFLNPGGFCPVVWRVCMLTCYDDTKAYKFVLHSCHHGVFPQASRGVQHFLLMQWRHAVNAQWAGHCGEGY